MSQHDIAIVVPLALNGCEHRHSAWQWVRAKYETEFPDWPILTGTVEGAWSKGAAVADALTKTDATTLVVADADVWCTDLGPFVEAVANRDRRWAQPHFKVFRFTEDATASVVAGEEPVTTALRRGTLDQTNYTACQGGGLVVIERDLYETCPLDPRFVGWGGEDEAWGWALTTMGGKRLLGEGICFHLWHPPQQRLNRKVGSLESESLRRRYQSAGGDVEAMRALIEEGRECRSMTSSSPRQQS